MPGRWLGSLHLMVKREDIGRENTHRRTARLSCGKYMVLTCRNRWKQYRPRGSHIGPETKQHANTDVTCKAERLNGRLGTIGQLMCEITGKGHKPNTAF